MGSRYIYVLYSLTIHQPKWFRPCLYLESVSLNHSRNSLLRFFHDLGSCETWGAGSEDEFLGFCFPKRQLNFPTAIGGKKRV